MKTIKIKPNKYTKFIKNNSGTLLSIAGCIGTVASTVLAIKTGMKIKENDMDVKEGIKSCVPVVLTCAGSIACVVAGDALNRKQKSELLATCALAGSSYSAYRKEVIKRYGEEVDKEIIDTVAECENYHFMAPDIPDKVCHWVLDLCDVRIPKYEFDACERDVIHAEYHINRNYILSGSRSVSDILPFFGIKETGDINLNKFGWIIDDSEIYFIDFVHRKLDDNTIEITPIWSPWYDYENVNMWGDALYDDMIAPFGDDGV